MVKSPSMDGDNEVGRLRVQAVAPYILLLAPQVWDTVGDPYDEVPLYKYLFTRFVSRGGKDAAEARLLSEKCVWEVCCPRDTRRKLVDRMREFTAAHPEGQLDQDQMVELAMAVQGQMWGTSLLEPVYPAFNLTEMCDLVANEVVRLIDNELGAGSGKFVKVHHVSLALASRSGLNENGMEISIEYDASSSSEEQAHLAIDRLYAAAIFLSAKKHFARSIKRTGGAVDEGSFQGSSYGTGENPETIEALIAMAEAYQKVKINFPGRKPGGATDSVSPDVMQKALLSDNLTCMQKIIYRVHGTSSKKVIFTTLMGSEGQDSSAPLVQILSQRNLGKGTSKAQLLSTLPPARSPS